MPDPVLIVMSGLPGTGKTTLSRLWAQKIGAVYLRIDSIEGGIIGSMLGVTDIKDSGYTVAHNLAKDNLNNGLSVVADSVNPLNVTRDDWRKVGDDLGIVVKEVEIICSHPKIHRHRIETRETNIGNRKNSTWDDVLKREYHSWDREHIVIDTAEKSVDESFKELIEALCL